MKKLLPIIFILIVVAAIIISLLWLRNTGSKVNNIGTRTDSGASGLSTKEQPSGTSAGSGGGAGTVVKDKTITPGANQISLKITSPADGAVVTSPTLSVKGITSPTSDVSVNDTQSKADAKGNFAITIQLDEDDNYIVVTANDQDGNVAEQEMTVTYNSPQ